MPKLPIVGQARPRKPEWLKIRPPQGAAYEAMRGRARRLKLATVCEEARCPNIAECWSEGTGTFMLMGEHCTRGCRFCAVETARTPPPLDPQEPAHIAEAVREMGLRYVVLTTVNRDDQEDGGAAHLFECVQRIHEEAPEVLIELLAPDFEGNLTAVALVAHAPIAVFAHNLETVDRLTARVRDPRAGYEQSLSVLEFAKSQVPEKLTKSSLMLGLGETHAEIEAAMADLRSAQVDILTLGQYLQPTRSHLPVARFLPPSEFEALEATARAMGFLYVAAGPLVRSSYRAGELFVERRLRGTDEAVVTPPAPRQARPAEEIGR